MSIDDDLLELDSITEGDRALALFTDRYEFTRLFVERLNDDPAPQTILFLYGEGGNGKSLLLKHLRKNACKRLISETDWQTIKAKPDAELADNITRLKPQVCRAVPTAFLDFGSKLLGNAQPQDRFYGLLTLRKDLGESAKGNYALAFRRFDFACVWYLYKKGKSPDEIKAFFPLDQAGNLASVLVDVLTKNPFGTASKAVLDAFNPEWSQKLMVQMARFGLDKDDIETIFRLNVDTNLIETLPRFLADDLNEAMAKDNAPPRIVLFFDTHEAFWGESRTEANITYFFRDEWLRYLLRKLDYEKGIVAVVAGRNQPRWAEAKTVKPNTDIPSQYIDLHRVGNLSAADALAYLQQPAVGIADVALCQSLIAYASVEPGEVHPLHLGLCADVVLQAQSQGTPLTAAAFNTVPEFAEKSKLLVERLLKYVNSNMRDAIYALSACRAFDFELFNQLGEALKFAPYRANFESITHFSFVKQLPTPRQSWHRLHNLLRRLNYQDGNERVSESHRFLEQLYRTKDDQAEAIYHLNQLSPSSGVEEWVSTFEQALRLSQYHACETLLEIRSDLRLISYFQLGSLSQAEGDYYHYLARVEEAEQEYVEAGWAFQRSREEEGNALGAIINQGNTYTKLGDLYRGRSRCPDALASYQKAITVYDETLQRTPDDIRILNNRGNALAHLGELQSEVSQHDDAFISFQMATESFDKVLQLDPDDIHALNNKGNTLQSIGRLCAKLSQHLEAMASYQQAIITYNEVLHHTPDEVQVLSNKGNVLAHLGESQVKLSKYTNALSSFQLAITSYNEALSHASDEIHISNNKGNALYSLAQLQIRLSDYTKALISVQMAIVSFDTVLHLAPDDTYALNNKGNALLVEGQLLAGRSQYAEALANVQMAIAAYDKALNLAPKQIQALNNKGNALTSLGELQVMLPEPTDALDSFQRAIIIFDEALRCSPDDIYTLNNKGNTLQSLAQLQAELKQHANALASFQMAIAVYDKTLLYAPDFSNALNNRGNALASLGLLQMELSQHTDSLASFYLATISYDEALRHTPNFINALSNRGSVLQSLGDLQVELSQNAEALTSYQQSIVAYDKALLHAPDFINALDNKGQTLIRLAALQRSLDQGARAVKSLQIALTSFSHSLSLAPNNSVIRNLHGQIQVVLAGDSSS